MGDHEKAEEMFYLARLYKEECPHCYYNIGCSLADRGLYDKAIFCWQKTLDLDDAHPDVRVRIAEALWSKGEFEQARQHYLIGLRRNPGDTETLLDLGELLIDMGRLDEAGEKFRRAIELSPEDPAGFYCHGRWLMRCDRLEEAELAFTKTLQLDPTYSAAHLRLAEVYHRLHKRDLARKHLKCELMLRPSEPQTILDMSNLLMDFGHSRAAIAALKRLLASDPRHVGALQNLAVAQFLAGKYEQGIATCLESLQLDPDNLTTIYNLALAYEHQKQFDEALAWVRKAMDLEPREASFMKLELRLRVLRLKAILFGAIGRIFRLGR